MSSIVTAKDGVSISVFQTAFIDDAIETKVYSPGEVTVAPLGSFVVPLCGMTKGTYLLFKINQGDAQTTTPRAQLTVTFAGSGAPSPATQTFLVKDFLCISSEFSALTIINPNSGSSPANDINAELIIIGT